MTELLVLSVSVILNCLFVHLASDYILRTFSAWEAKLSPLNVHLARIARSILVVCIWGGSTIYFTFGAIALIRLENPTYGLQAFGDWRDTFGVVNGVFPVLLVMFAVRRAEKRAKVGQSAI